MSQRELVPRGEDRYEFFSKKTWDDLQKYRFYDDTEKKLRYLDDGREADNSRIYIFEVEDIDKKLLVKDIDRLVKYTDTDTLFVEEIKGGSFRRRPTARRPTAKKGGKNRRSSNNKQKTRKTRKQ